MELDSINKEQGLYVIKAGKGYSCLGFEYAEKRMRKVAEWMNWIPGDIGHTEPGTAEHYAQYLMIMGEGAKYASDNATRCPAELIPELIGLEGQRVEVTTPEGKSRFIVGKSTGWLPCHLEIKRRNSSGGGAVYFPKGSKVRTV